MRTRARLLGAILTGASVLGFTFAAIGDSVRHSGSSPPTAASSLPTSIQMNRIAVLPPADGILSAAGGLDFDHDGQREFILRRGISGLPNKPLDFYESASDNFFHLVHVLELGNDGTDLYLARDAGDIDEDDLADLVVIWRDNMAGGVQDFGTQVYESDSPNTYPTELTWVVVSRDDGWSHAGIGDTDGDGKQEIVVVEPILVSDRKLVFYENDGDDLYNETVSVPTSTAQSFEITSDLDGDGKDEILVGRFGSITAFESTGDDAYELIWSWDFDPNINLEFLVDAGDLDGDGKKEFLTGGLAPNGPFGFVAHVFEAVSDNDFEIVATFANPYGDINSQSVAAVADVDGDGNREIVLGSGNTLRIYKNAGGFGWSEIWTNTMGNLWALGTGDHDADGKDELIVGEAFVNITSIWEIDPADAADMDGDEVVDAIDNCPLTGNPGQEDADGDTVGDVCDNCIYGPNPTQGPAIFGQQIQALNSETFSWDDPAEIVYVRGDLALVSTYTVDLVQSLPLGTSFVDPTVLGPSQGLFYLVKPDCGVGSWQSDLGVEPGRDAALP